MIVPGHKSQLAFGLMGPPGGESVPVVAMLGRVRTRIPNLLLYLFHCACGWDRDKEGGLMKIGLGSSIRMRVTLSRQSRTLFGS